MLRFSQQWPFTGHGSHPENTPRPTRRRSSALKPNSKRSSRYQATPSEKKALIFIPSLSSPFPKNTGGTRTRRLNSDRKRFEGDFFKLRLTVKAKEAHPLYTACIVMLMRSFFIVLPIRDMSSFHLCILLSATALIRNFNDRGFYDRGAFGKKKLLASNYAENWLKSWRANPFFAYRKPQKLVR